MKILYIVNAYPTKQKPYYGIYIKEQYEYIKENFNLESKIIILKGSNGFKKYFQPFKILDEIKDYNPDIIHVHYGLTGLPLLLIYPLIRKINIISTFHGSDINGNKIVMFLSRILANISVKNIAVSKEIFNKLNKNKDKTLHIPCGVDPLFVTSSKRRERKNKIIFSGHPNRLVKNYKLFENVIKILKDKYEQNPEVIIFDNKSREEIKEALLTSKCLLMTSLSEGSPQVVKEAITCDLPIVSTPVGDVPYLLDSLKNCYIAQSAEDLAEKVNFVLSQDIKSFPEERKHKLNNQYICNEVVNLYKKVNS